MIHSDFIFHIPLEVCEILETKYMAQIQRFHVVLDRSGKECDHVSKKKIKHFSPSCSLFLSDVARAELRADNEQNLCYF